MRPTGHPFDGMQPIAAARNSPPHKMIRRRPPPAAKGGGAERALGGTNELSRCFAESAARAGGRSRRQLYKSAANQIAAAAAESRSNCSR